MDEELVLLTSYFNLVDGRRQDTADTFRVESDLSSSTSPDGHAALYLVTEASAAGHMGARARQLAANTVAWEYASNAAEAPVARLRAALRAAHRAILDEFDGHVTVGISVMVVEGDTVSLGQVAPAQVYVLHDGGLHSIAATVEGTSPFARALGTSSTPRISVFRDQISPGDVLALTSSWFQRTIDPEDLRLAFAAGGADEISSSLLDLAREHDARAVTAVVVEAVPAEELQAELAEHTGPGFLEQVDGAVAALAGVGRMLWQELQPPVRAPQPSPAAAGRTAVLDEVEEAPATPEPAPEPEPVEAPVRPWHRVVEQATEEIPIVPPAASVPDLSSWEERPRSQPPPIEHAAAPPEPVAEPEPEPVPEPEPEPEPEPVSEMEQVNSRLQNAPDLGNVIPPVQAFPDTSTEPERIYATSKDIQAVNRRPRRFGGIGRPIGREPGVSLPVIRPGPGEMNLDRPAVRNAPPPLVWVGAGIVALLAILAIWRFVSHSHGLATNPYPAYVRQDIALAAHAKTHVSQNLYLGKAKHNLALAKQYGADSATLATLKHHLQATSDTLHHITRITHPLVLGTFQQPTALAATPGDVLVLDAGRKSVFTVSQTPGPGATEIVRSGDIIGQFTVGTPVQIASDGTEVLVLDDHNTLVRDSNGTKTATTLSQGAPNERLAAMGVVDPDLYLLDTASSQVWRYPYATSLNTYNPSALGFFSPINTSLHGATSFTTDGTNIYFLLSNGTVQKFDILHANPQPFTLPHLHTPLHAPDSIFTDQGLNYVWIADPANGRIVQLTKTGSYVRVYRSSGSLNLHHIQGIAVGPKGTNIYILSGPKLYSVPVVP